MISDPRPQTLFIVTDIKQYAHCPRITYFERCLSHIRPRTYKMDDGVLAHEEEQKLAGRRTLQAYRVIDGERIFNVLLSSESYSLSGTLDEVVRTTEGDVIPVDYKGSHSIQRSHKLQLAAYTMLLEADWGIVIPYGFIYLIPKRKAVRIPMTDAIRQEVKHALAEMRRIVEAEQIPPPMPLEKRALCVACEFRRFCNDV